MENPVQQQPISVPETETKPVTTEPTINGGDVVGASPAADEKSGPETTAPKPAAANGSTNLVKGDELPNDKAVTTVLDADVYDKTGKAVKFRTLVENTPNRRNLVVFIRHFYCGYCQEYIRALARDLSPSTLAGLTVPTTLTIIGCGDSKLIDAYAKETSCPYEIYADPARTTYKALELVVSLGSGKKPKYIGTSFLTSTFAGIKQGLSAGFSTAMKSGKISQNGAETVWLDGELKFIHKMRDTMSHMEVEDVKAVLESGTA